MEYQRPSARYNIYRSIGKYENQLDTTTGIQAQIRKECHEVLDKAKGQLVNEQEPAEIEKLLEPLPAKIKTASEASDKFRKDILEPLRARIKGMKPGESYRNKLLGEVGQIELAVNAGQFDDLNEAQKTVDEAKTNVETWASIIAMFDDLLDPKEDVLAKLERAATLSNMQQIIKSKRDGEAMVARRGVSGERTIQIVPAIQTWASFVLDLKVRRIVMTILLYMFTLTVGYITLYAKAPTFGADVENYLTLFLWGVSVNVVGGQAIDLKAIYSQKGK